MANLKAIGLALIQYEQDHHERYPSASHWMNQVTPYLPDQSALYDPFSPGKPRYGYAFNRNCSQKPLSAFDAPASTVAVYESSLGTRNASDTGQSPFLHSVQRPGMMLWAGSGYGFADGHVKWFTPDVHPTFSLKGGQPTAFSEWQAKVRADYLVKHYKGNLRVYGTLNNGATVLLGATKPNQKLNQAQFLAGLTPVQGSGVIVTLTDSKKAISTTAAAGFDAAQSHP